MTDPFVRYQQWFDDAARCYVEKHQGCPWCGGQHRVYHLVRGTEQTYTCQNCDFQAQVDGATAEYSHIVGENLATTSSPTMFK